MKIFSESHKTVFVVDHCPYMAESCRQHVEFDMLVKNRTQGIIPLAPISKSLWTCSVESSMEYCRIMYDIFPFKKLVNFIVSDSGAHVLNSWTQEDQNLQELMAALAAVGPPNPRADPECCSILHGLVAAVEALCKITEYQHEARTMLMENAERVGNRGRIICITNAKSDSHVRMLEDCVQETIHEHNKLAANSDHLMQIQKCELVLIHTYPVGEDSLVSDRPKKELSPVLTSEVHSVRAGRHLATKLNVLVQQHFDLASTTITNIPMKEEQHANTSANYDVELLHHKEAHVDFLKSGDNHVGGNSREGTFKETVTLKWCTPRTNSVVAWDFTPEQVQHPDKVIEYLKGKCGGYSREAQLTALCWALASIYQTLLRTVQHPQEKEMGTRPTGSVATATSVVSAAATATPGVDTAADAAAPPAPAAGAEAPPALVAGTAAPPSPVAGVAVPLPPAAGTAAESEIQPVPVSVAPVQKKKYTKKSVRVARDDDEPGSSRVQELQGRTTMKGDPSRKSAAPVSSGRLPGQSRRHDLASDPLEGTSKSFLQELIRQLERFKE